MKLALVGVWVGIFAVSVAGPVLLEAQQGASKVGYVNTQMILKQTPGYVRAESTFTGSSGPIGWRYRSFRRRSTLRPQTSTSSRSC